MQDRRSDELLVAAALGGERGAFGVLLSRHERGMRLLVGRMLDPSDAEDVVQEASLQAFLGLDRLRNRERFGGWLCAIALNLAKMRLRARRHAPFALGLPARPAEDALEAKELALAVRAALDALPPHEREAVLLYYVDGLSCPEVASVLGEREGTVRVRLHRARRRMAARLHSLAPEYRRETTMVEVVVDDVVAFVSSANDERRLESEKRIVLLKESAGERILPIWIGAPEGDALVLQRGGEELPRPLTPDLMAGLVAAAGAEITRVVVSRLHENTFYATIDVAARGATKQVDARPSDALNLAARVNSPIYVDEAVMEHAFTGDVQSKLAEEQTALGIETPAAGQWQSLTPDLVTSFRAWEPPGR
jgi:uncharacterized protein